MSNKKNILFILNFSQYGGVETVFFTFLKILKDKYNFMVISPNEIPNNIVEILNENNVDCCSCRKKRFRFKNILNWLFHESKTLCGSEKAKQMLNIADYVIDFKNGRSFLKKNKVNKPKILWVHCGIPFFLKKSRKINFSMYDKVVGLTDSILTYFQESNPKLKDKFIRIYNPMDIAVIKNAAKEPVVMPYEYFLCVSRLDVDKDNITIIDAYCSFIKNTNSKTKLVFIGDGCKRDEIEEYVRSKNLLEKVVFLGAKYPPYNYMVNAKACLLSSVSEGLPCILIEYLVATKGVVISSDCLCGPREILQDGKSGLLFPIQDVSALSECLQKVDVGEITRDNFADNIPLSLERFLPEKIYQEFEDLITTIS